jgi:hypothetical protein
VSSETIHLVRPKPATVQPQVFQPQLTPLAIAEEDRHSEYINVPGIARHVIPERLGCPREALDVWSPRKVVKVHTSAAFPGPAAAECRQNAGEPYSDTEGQHGRVQQAVQEDLRTVGDRLARPVAGRRVE